MNATSKRNPEQFPALHLMEVDRIQWALRVAAKLTTESERRLFAEYISRGGGYIHGFNVPNVSAADYANRSSECIPPGAQLVVCHWGHGVNRLPVGSIRVGQYKVRSGDPESPIYLCPGPIATA